ncbi:MAG TPA: HupE/UreJ family protein [Bryobacteraceae bacterium]|jgi:hydrogenase/urease accessory protein HupE|nr:HupE/UreJ family protein [Bryobacteraceae bacterium]
MRSAAILLGLFVLSGSAFAHDVSRSDSKVEIQGREVRVALTLNLKELQNSALPSDSIDLNKEIGPVWDSVRRHFIVRSPAFPVESRLESYSVLGGSLIQLRILYLFEQDVTALEVKSTLFEIMPAGHQHMMNVRLNGTLHEAILDSRTQEATFSGVETTNLQTIWRFVRLGVEHIFTGYDHLAFLLGLLVATSTLGSLVKIITSFTIAHSITLALATFNLVMLPPRLTESLIALSIGYVAAENLLDFRAMKRYYITFLFGLVHGFGFSSVLREMDLPKSSLALSLFSFNAGVEIGQITFVVLIFPLVQDLVSSGWKRLKPAVSIGVACLAAYWFVQRAFLG